MTKIVKRLPVLALVSIILIAILSGGSLATRHLSAATAVATVGSPPAPAGGGTPAAQPSQAALPATKPVIHANLNGTDITGAAGSFCWPQTDAALPQCDFQPDIQPNTPVNVTLGDSLVFTVVPPSPAPISMRATLLDDKNADGDTVVTDLSTTGNIFTVENLAAGNHRLEVDAIYAGEVQGNRPFVGYVYLLSVAGGNVVVGTAAPTTAGTAAVTAVAQASAAATTPATVAAPTEIPLPTATLIEPTAVATEFPTIIAPTSVPTTVESTAVVVTVEVPTAVQPSATPLPLITSTPLPPTATAEPPTIEPPATSVPPTPAPLPTTAPTELSPITAGMIPPLLITVGGRIYQPIAVNSCTLGTGGESVCVNRPADTSSPRIVASPADAAQITFQGPRPTSVTATLYSSDGTKVLDKQTIKPDNLILYTLPSAAGNYVLAFEISYPQGKATYYFRLGINAS